MEPHPVPQNITAFEFHLVGDMTLKQFGFLATGLVIAYLTFVLLFQAAPLIAVPVIAISAGLGVAFAFLPMYDRPLSHWMMAYFRAIYAPTVRYWQSPLSPNNTVTVDDPTFTNRLASYLKTLNPSLATTLETAAPASNQSVRPTLHPLFAAANPAVSSIPQQPPQPVPLQSPPVISKPVPPSAPPINLPPIPPQTATTTPHPLFAASAPPPQPPPLPISPTVNLPPRPTIPQPPSQPTVFFSPQPSPPVQPPAPPSSIPAQPQNLPKAQELNELVKLAQEARFLQSKVAETQRHINELRAMVSTRGATNAETTQQAQDMFSNLQTLIKQTEDVSSKTSQVVQIKPHPRHAKVVVVQPVQRTPTEVLLTSSPNVINGIVTDPSSNYLEGVIAIIHNKDNMPVRALKTNKLGQFAGATPLPSGIYTLTLEKDNLEFDTIQITLNGEVLAPLKLSAKKGLATLDG